jgi:hypothetical protein
MMRALLSVPALFGLALGVVSDAAAQTISSATNQSFCVGAPAAQIAKIAITDNALTPVIVAGTDLRVRIPAGFPMVWDVTDATPVLGGSAAARVASSVTFEDAGATLVLDVLTDFAPQDMLTVSGLSFTGFVAAAGPNHLELEAHDDDVVSALDDKTVAIGAPTISSAMAERRRRHFVANRTTITEDAVMSTITAPATFASGSPEPGNDPVRDRRPRGPRGPAAAIRDRFRSKARIHFVLDVAPDFAPGDVLVDGLRFATTAPSPPTT